MASYLQEILKAQNFSMETLSTSRTDNTTQSSSPTLDGSTGLFTLLPLIFSLPALRDWFKLIVLGGFFESCRRMASGGYSRFTSSFFMTAVFDEDDATYEWMMVWLAKQPTWAQSRHVEISTDTFGANNTNAVLLESEDTDPSSSKHDHKTSRKVSYIPSAEESYSFWYKHRYLTIQRLIERDGRYNQKSMLHVRILTCSTNMLVELLQDARKEYILAQENTISIYVADSYNDWRHVNSRPKRSMQSIILDPGIKDRLLHDARDFLASRKWYNERGIPFRRGYLLYGAPGTGKTSLIHSIAGELDLDVYIVSLSKKGLDDTALDTLINNLPERCVALMEDIDAAFTNKLTREDPEGEDEHEKEHTDEAMLKGRERVSTPPATVAGSVSLSGLLNALDGIGAHEGRILFATTNKYTSLDPALCRPGRMDLHIEFKLASKSQIRELFWRFYNPIDDLHDSGNDDGEREFIDSGYASASSSPTFTPETEKLLPSIFGDEHSHVARLPNKEIKALAAQFANLIPERKFSMASLQGFLMTYKTMPHEAVRNVSEWVANNLPNGETGNRKKNETLPSPTVEVRG